RLETLYDLLCTFEAAPTLVFCNYRESTETVSDFLWSKEVVNDYYHGLLEQQDRERSLIKLRNGSVNVLVATDLAARGLDIDALRYVVHYEMPMSEEAFIHRSGRTGRMNSEGENYIIASRNGYMPDFVSDDTPSFDVEKTNNAPKDPAWDSLYIGAGKKDKISKGDIAGFLTQVGGLEFSEIGMIIIRDSCSYAAIKFGTLNDVLKRVKGMKLKKSKCRFDACR
ncbi:MAG: helicase-related protein, partial [Rikenellaceae bacterium]